MCVALSVMLLYCVVQELLRAKHADTLTELSRVQSDFATLKAETVLIACYAPMWCYVIRLLLCRMCDVLCVSG